MKARRLSLRLPLWSAVMALAAARASPAQALTCPIIKIDTATVPARWAPPLDRVISLRAADLSLRDALDRVAATARLRVSYSTELLPLDRAVCLSAAATPVGKVISDLLLGTNVAAIGVGGDQVVLAPRREPTAPLHASEPGMATSLGMLDRVVVTGSATGSTSLERELTVGLNTIDGRQLARENTSSISDALDSYVPGVWGWSQPPSTMMSSYASIRGASSFGLSYPKVYIDGIEVANPLLLSRFNPGSIERIEVIRGPQGSALYGTDAISGVVNIITKHEGAAPDGSRALVRSTAGLAQSMYGNVLAQDHTLSLATGTNLRSADLNVSIGSIGSFVPDGYSRDLMATGSARIVGSRSSLNTTARLFMQQAGTPNSPLVMHTRPPNDSTPVQSVSEYTLGATATRAIDEQWTMSLVAGVDGYRLSHVETNFAPIPSVLDSALKAAEGGADRATIRASTVYQFNPGAATRATFTITGEHAAMRLSTRQPSQITETRMGPSGTTALRSWEALRTAQSTAAAPVVTSWQNSTGIVTQTNLAFDDALFFTSGLRFEHDSRLTGADLVEMLPMFGVAAVTERGPFTVKLRSAYGKGIRPPTTPSRLQFWQTQNGIIAQDALGPERQSGIESGIDVMVKHALSFQATRFDQRASGLIQPVAVPVDSVGYRMLYLAQNVGEISNRGWEFQATANVSRLSVTGTLSLVDSRVEKLAPGYRGDLVIGDHMLQVPAQTQSINFAWTAPKWHLNVAGSRALDWINYDELKLTQAVANRALAKDLSGARLRDYWKHYDGGMRLRAALSRDLRDNFSLEVSAENLLNHQTGEPDNITVIPGRTLMTGVKLKF